MGGNIDTGEPCGCGEPLESHAHGAKGHTYVPASIASYLRSTQRYKRGYVQGRYSLKESRILTIKKPAAGVDVKASVTAPAKWMLWSLRASLTTSGVVANRVPHLQITDGPNGNVVLDFPASGNQTAGSTIAYSASAGGVVASFDNTNVFVLPAQVEMLQGWTIGFATTAIDAGDQWSALALMIEETLYF